MSLLDKLKEIVKIDVNLKNLVNININSNNNNSHEPYEYNEAEKKLTINLDNFSDPEKVGEFLRQCIQDNIPIMEDTSFEKYIEIKKSEQDPDVIKLLSFFKGKIPNNDYDALRSAIYIRKCFRDGVDSKTIYNLKGDVINKYGRRGLNICNLCTSGYFENLLIPLHNEIQKSPTFSDGKFEELYNTIIKEEAFAVFIKSSISTPEVKNAIEGQIRRNLKYGIKYVNIHGIGYGNIGKIKEVISNIEMPTLNIHEEIELDGNIILATLFFDNS
ncbi:MAG: hypothetical protein K0A90_08655 [Methanosarcinaceae archaeon]|nr:hypothetical protein [Methanosarcinaceae archaeon]